jgi:integrase
MRVASRLAPEKAHFVTGTCNTLGVALFNQRGGPMAALTGLFQRGTAYYLRVVLPNNHPMKRQYKNGEFVTSLGRCTHREATTRGTLKRAEILDGRFVIDSLIRPSSQMAVQPVAGNPLLRDVYQRWKDSKPRSSDSLNNCLRAVTLFEEFTANTPINQLTREQGDGFRTWLQHPDRRTASKTARDRLTWVKSVLKYAARDLGLIPRNPWEGIDITFKTTNKRRPWAGSELETLFSQPLHTAYKLPTDKKAGADAAYWLPLLGLYTGARVGELAQLQVIDIELIDDIHLISITDAGEGQSVKSEAGIRKVPIHRELIRLGLLDYVSAMKQRKEVLLWPSLPIREGKPGGYFSAWFGEYRRFLGFGLYPDFHCLRHTVRSQMADADVQEQVIDAIVGHEIKGSTGAKVYTHRTVKALKSAIELLSYPALALNRVYPCAISNEFG